MTRIRSKRRIGRALLTMVVGAAIAIGSAAFSAHAADDDDDELPDTKIFKGILRGLGLKQEGDGIDYRERPPLVVPSTRTLPNPEPSNQPTAANWPVDPDVARAKKRKTEKKFSNPEPEDDGRPLLPNQYSLPGGASRTSRPVGGETSAEQREQPSSPYELGSKNFFTNWFASKEEYKPFTAEPPRTRLIEPPAGYRTPAGSQPYGVGEARWKQTAPVDRLEPVR
jgi:hypothetical protein